MYQSIKSKRVQAIMKYLVLANLRVFKKNKLRWCSFTYIAQFSDLGVTLVEQV